LGIEASEGLMIGDKLTTDILGSNRIGMRNVWINHHRIAKSDEIVPSFEIRGLNDLPAIIQSLV
jgi:putative hydrolase of the HAD superfamily